MPKYEIQESVKVRLDHTFTYHPPKNDQPERYEAIRAKAKELAFLIIGETPVSREQSLAITALETCIYNANAAIASEISIATFRTESPNRFNVPVESLVS